MGNDQSFIEDFFQQLLVNVSPSFHQIRDWRVKRRWVKDKSSVATLAGSLAGAMVSESDRIPSEIDESLQEAIKSYQGGNWKSCVVMSRRAMEAVIEFAYHRFFKKSPKGMDFNGLIRAFEKSKPPIIPVHWINILDSIRNIGNVPGAHAKQIKRYKFSRSDAQLSLENATAFREAYFSKIDPQA